MFLVSSDVGISPKKSPHPNSARKSFLAEKASNSARKSFLAKKRPQKIGLPSWIRVGTFFGWNCNIWRWQKHNNRFCSNLFRVWTHSGLNRPWDRGTMELNLGTGQIIHQMKSCPLGNWNIHVSKPGWVIFVIFETETGFSPIETSDWRQIDHPVLTSVGGFQGGGTQWPKSVSKMTKMTEPGLLTWIFRFPKGQAFIWCMIWPVRKLSPYT